MKYDEPPPDVMEAAIKSLLSINRNDRVAILGLAVLLALAVLIIALDVVEIRKLKSHIKQLETTETKARPETRCGTPEGAAQGWARERTGSTIDGGKTIADPHDPRISSAAARVSTILSRLIAAIRIEESRGDDRSTGDNGSTRGPYHISLDYWTDGGGDRDRYGKDVWIPELCRPVIISYWRRFQPVAVKSLDLEKLARTHNGGPGGPMKPATVEYWRRIQLHMETVTATATAI